MGVDKEKMSAFVDIPTGKIVGANKGTRTYLHEKGHIIYNKSEIGMRNSFREQSSFQLAVYLGIFSFLFPILRWYALGMIMCSIYYFVYEESWCWGYALNKFKGGKNKNGIQEKEKR